MSSNDEGAELPRPEIDFREFFGAFRGQEAGYQDRAKSLITSAAFMDADRTQPSERAREWVNSDWNWALAARQLGVQQVACYPATEEARQLLGELQEVVPGLTEAGDRPTDGLCWRTVPQGSRWSSS
jgi:hypothetical protein